jgi:hypothetical protein
MGFSFISDARNRKTPQATESEHKRRRLCIYCSVQKAGMKIPDYGISTVLEGITRCPQPLSVRPVL